MFLWRRKTIMHAKLKVVVLKSAARIRSKYRLNKFVDYEIKTLDYRHSIRNHTGNKKLVITQHASLIRKIQHPN